MKALFIVVMSITLANTFAYSPKFMRQPAVSPDGLTICFSYMSDLWTVPFTGGEAKRLTVSEGNDSTPIYSPDGKWIAFTSTRDGFRGVYKIPSTGGKAQLVSSESYLSISDWFPDNERLMGTRFKRETGSGQYIINLDGRRIQEITPISHHFSKLSPCEETIIFNMRGYPYRPAYQGSMAGNLWEYNIHSKEYTKLTYTETTERYPVYSQTNPYIYYGGSDGNKFQLFRVKNYDFENKKQLTDFHDWSVRNISIARVNDRIAFEKFDKIWGYDPHNEKVEEVEIIIKQDFLDSFEIEETFTNAAHNAAISPDGKLVAFSYKYDLFAVPEKGGKVKRLTYDQKGIDDIIILPDNRTILFLKRDKGSYHIFSVDINEPQQIVKNNWSEGKYIRHIYMISSEYMGIHYKVDEDNWRVAIMDIQTGKIKNIIEDHHVWSWFLTFTPELDYAFFVTGRPNIGSRHLKLYDLKNGYSKELINSINYIGNLYLGMDNKSLFMTLDSKLIRLDLVPTPDFLKITDNWDDILDKKSETKSGRIRRRKREEDNDTFKVETENIESRINTVCTKPGINYVVHVESDSTLYYVNRDPSGHVYTLRKIDYWGENDEDIVTITGRISGYTTAFEYNESNNHFYVVVDDRLMKINPISKRTEVVENHFNYNYNEIDLNKSVFDEIWVEFGNNFYDPDMHGKDWKAMYDTFRPYVDYTYRIDYLEYIIDEMIGRLNASHTGFTPTRRPSSISTELAFLGFTLDYSELLDKGIKIRSVYRGSTIYQKYGIREGDLLLEVDGIKITPHTTIADLFTDKVDQQVHLNFRTSDGDINAIIRGLSAMQQYNLYYEDMVIRRRKFVESSSDGIFGYLHIPRMQPERIEEFINDLFARNYDKEGIVIDIRGNSGGRISRDLLDILSRRSRAYTTSRGYPDQMFQTPNRIWDKPTVLLIDETSFSDAEIFPILFRQKELGIVVGMPTSGGVIGTTPYTLMDGSTLRMPRSGWYTKEGINMEGTGAQPDVIVKMSPENIINDNDVQLKKAIKVLFEQLDNNNLD